MNFIKRFFDNIRFFFINLTLGAKNAEDLILKQTGISNEIGTTISQEVHSNRVSRALLKGEVTQEVKELRYRTYEVDKESKSYEYYAPTLALKREDKQDNKFISYENSEELEVITVQENFPITEGLYTEYTDDLLKVGTYGKRTEYTIKMNYDGFTPRYNLETYTKRLVVKKVDEKNVRLDFYVTIYPDENFKPTYNSLSTSKGFVREIERIKNEGVRSDVLDIKEVRFISNKAYKIDDMLEYEFNELVFDKIVEFDGNYIIKFTAKHKKDILNLYDKFYCKEMAEKYARKEKKDLVLDLTGGVGLETYTCEMCGKEIIYDTEEMNLVPITRPREIDEENVDGEEGTNVMEYMDIQMAEQTFGKRLCRECLKKYLAQHKMI